MEYSSEEVAAVEPESQKSEAEPVLSVASQSLVVNHQPAVPVAVVRVESPEERPEQLVPEHLEADQ
jgi:hypothetical protein